MLKEYQVSKVSIAPENVKILKKLSEEINNLNTEFMILISSKFPIISPKCSRYTKMYGVGRRASSAPEKSQGI